MIKKKVLITGCSGAIGREMVSNFYKKKYIVIGVDKFSPSSKKGLDFFAKCNLSSDTEVNKLFKKIEKKYKSIDIIINCVGHIHNELLVNHNKKFIFHSYKNWKKTIDNNLNNVFIITRNFIKLLMNSRSHKKLIINFSSVNSKGVVGQSAYSASKKAIEVLTKIWSHELAPFKIRVASIAPGYIELDSTNKKLNKNKKEKIISEIPLKKFGEIKSIINGINFIVNNNYFNGKTLNIDGGL